MKRLTSFTLALGLLTAPLPVFAAPPPEGVPGDVPSEAVAVGGNIAMFKFSGDPVNSEGLRGRVSGAFEAAGYAPVNIKPTIEAAAEKNKCRKIDGACLEKIGPYLNKNAKTAFNFFVYGDIPAAGTGRVILYDIAKNKIVSEVVVNIVTDDYILPEVFGAAVARELVDYQVPPAPPTENDKLFLATIDEPEKTSEEIAAEAKAILDAEEAARKRLRENLDVGAQVVDLRADFKDYCRTGPRQDTEVQNLDGTVDKERDLSPVCKRGPVFGYFQPRAWVALTLTIGTGAAMGAMYGLAAAARSDWKSAKDKLDSSGLSGTDPNLACEGGASGGVCYQDLAGQVSETGTQIRRRAIVGDVLLGGTVLLAGVFAIIVSQDRGQAKQFIGVKKELKALSSLRVTPGGVSFEF